MKTPSNGQCFVIGGDFGHGNIIAGNMDSGAVGPAGTWESNNVVGIGVAFEERMKARLGDKVRFVRGREPGNPLWVGSLNADLASRYNKFDQAGCDLTVSIHNDSADVQNAARITTYIIGTGGEAEKIARLVQAKACAAVGFERYGQEDGGVRVANFAMVREPDAPSILIETGFISNPGEEQELSNPEIQQALGYAIADGILEYLEVPAPAETISGVKVVFAKENKTIQGVWIGERTYVATRDVANALGRAVEWKQGTQTATIK